MCQLSDSRQAGSLSKVEITPAMIGAGVYALAQRLESHSEDALVLAVYSAMKSARVRPNLDAMAHSEGAEAAL